MNEFASFDVPLWVWAALVASIAAMLIIDLLLVHRTAHVIKVKEAMSSRRCGSRSASPSG